MKTKTCSSAAAWLAAIVLTTFTFNANAAGRGNDGKVGGKVSGLIFMDCLLDDNYLGDEDNPNDLIGDGFNTEALKTRTGTFYTDGEENAELTIGRNFNIQLDYNTLPKKKPPVRKLMFALNEIAVPNESGDLVDADGNIYADPIFNNAEDLVLSTRPGPGDGYIDAELRFSGQDHDDSPLYIETDLVPCQRNVTGRLKFRDCVTGETWYVYYGRYASGGGNQYSPSTNCIEVRRFFADCWEFSTAPDGIGYLYYDNRPPHSPSELWGVIKLSFSGVLFAKTEGGETVPDPAECLNPVADCPPLLLP